MLEPWTKEDFKHDGAGRLADVLSKLDVPVSQENDVAFLVTLPGERRHRTLVWFIVGDHHLLIESFVCRAPDENAAVVYQYLLQRNSRLRTIAYTLDAAGDIHLVGRLGMDRITVAEIDTVLGVLLETADTDWNAILLHGFPSAIRREWAWRTSRGETIRNLEAFRHLVTASKPGPSDPGPIRQ